MGRRKNRLTAARLVATGLGALAISAPGLACGDDEAEEPAGRAEPAEETTAPDDGGAGGSSAVEAFDFGFRPEEATVEPGTTVTWENTGETVHNVKGKGFFSEAIDPGDSYGYKFTKAGSYDYLCTLHPDSMRGTVVVEK